MSMSLLLLLSLSMMLLYLVVNDDAGLAILEPPQLEAKHSLCIDDHKKDLEVINDFDPVAAWNSFAVQKKEQW